MHFSNLFLFGGLGSSRVLLENLVQGFLGRPVEVRFEGLLDRRGWCTPLATFLLDFLVELRHLFVGPVHVVVLDVPQNLNVVRVKGPLLHKEFSTPNLVRSSFLKCQLKGFDTQYLKEFKNRNFRRNNGILK